MAEIRAVRVVVKGRVQGVFFRASTVDAARSLGLAGWVRNRADGAVELFAEGEPDRVRELISWCRQGPPLAYVTDVAVTEASPRGGKGFDIVR